MTTIAHGFVYNNKLTGLEQKVLHIMWMSSVSSNFLCTQLADKMQFSISKVIQKSAEALHHQTKFSDNFSVSGHVFDTEIKVSFQSGDINWQLICKISCPGLAYGIHVIIELWPDKCVLKASHGCMSRLNNNAHGECALSQGPST